MSCECKDRMDALEAKVKEVVEDNAKFALVLHGEIHGIKPVVSELVVENEAGGG